MARVGVSAGRWPLVLGLALVLLGAPPSRGGQAARAPVADIDALRVLPLSPAGRLDAYLKLAARYRSGDSRPVSEIRRWLPVEVELAIDELCRRGDAVRESPRAPGGIAVHDVEAAILLHAHVAFLALRRAGLTEANAHLTSAWRLFTWISALARSRAGRSADPAGRIALRIEPREFYMGIVGSTLALWKLDSAEDFAKKGLRQLPKDAQLLLLAGCVQDAIAIQLSVEGDGGGARKRRTNAERLYRSALAVGGVLEEARLRLGRVRLTQGRVTQAEEPLATVAQGAGDRRQRYLAWLFLGQLYDRRQRPARAAHAYQQALALYPDAQAARLGLAWVEDRQAGAAAARRTLLEGFTRPQTEAARDPWLEYAFGPPGLAGAALERMYQRVVTP
jgi:tetratricopeptide (TPR) repeat protein